MVSYAWMSFAECPLQHFLPVTRHFQYPPAQLAGICIEICIEISLKSVLAFVFQPWGLC